MMHGKRLVIAALLAATVAGFTALASGAPAYARPAIVPVTSAALTPAANSAGWNHGPVTVTLTVEIPLVTASGTGTVNGTVPVVTFYRFGGSGDYEGYSIYDPANKPVVSAEGTTVVWFYSAAEFDRDTGDVVQLENPAETPKSVTVNVDTAAPTTAAAVDPPPDAAGIDTTPVTVTLSATDAVSGVDKTYYRLGAAGDYAEYGGPLTIATEGTTEVFFYSTDKAGNAETPKSVTVTIDYSPPVPRPLSGYGTVVVRRGGTATIVYTVRDATSSTARVTLQIVASGRVVKTIGLGTRATNQRLTARFSCHLAPGVYRYRIVARTPSGLQGRYLKGYLAIGDRPTAYIEGAAGVQSGQKVSLRYLLVDPYARSAHLKILIMLPAKAVRGSSAGGSATANRVVKVFDLGTRPTNVVGTATFRCTVDPGLYRWAFQARDSIGAQLRTTSNLVWVW